MAEEEDFSFSSSSSEDFDFSSDSDDDERPTNYEFSKEDYKKGLKLGEGAFASVYRWDKINPDDDTIDLPRSVAIKEIKEDGHHTREKDNLSRLRHPNVVRFYCAFELAWRTLGIVTELCGGTLEDFMNHRGLRFYEVSRIIRQLLSGVAYLHKKEVIHRDIKLSNILVMCSEREFHWATINTDKLTLKLGDFGLSRGFNTLRQNETTLTVVGTVDMMAPEVKEAYMNGDTSAKYGSKADIWPIGMIAYMAVKGKLPRLQTNGIEPEGIAEDESLDVNGFREFLLRAFQRDPRRRGSAKTLLKFKFISDYEPLIGDVYPAVMTDDLEYLKRVVEMYDYSDANGIFSEFTDYNCKHPLYYAAEVGHLEQVKVLADKVGTRCLDESKALVAAAMCSNEDVVRYLVNEQGADVGVKDEDGKSAYDWARQKSLDQEIVDMLMRS